MPTAMGGSIAIGNFAAALGIVFLNVLFYFTLTLMLGTLSEGHGVVIAIPIAIAFGYQRFLWLAPWVADVTPWGFLQSAGSPADDARHRHDHLVPAVHDCGPVALRARRILTADHMARHLPHCVAQCGSVCGARRVDRVRERSTMDQPTTYRIRIKGHLAVHWAEWFDGLTITHLDNGETLINGPVVDQAALHGMLNHIRDLGLPLLAVDQVEPDEPSPTDRH